MVVSRLQIRRALCTLCGFSGFISPRKEQVPHTLILEHTLKTVMLFSRNINTEHGFPDAQTYYKGMALESPGAYREKCMEA